MTIPQFELLLKPNFSYFSISLSTTYIMKVLKIIGIVVLVILLAAAGWVMTLSGESHLERTVTVNASVEKVYATVNDFGQIKHWSPWFKIDPETVYTYSDNLVGAGANYSWTSEHPDVGTGSQDLLSSQENSNVKTKMVFGEDMTGTYTADFILEADGEGTRLTWTFNGKADAMSEKIFTSMIEYILGPTYDQGIADLKTYIEGLPDPVPVMEGGMMDSDSTMVEEVVEEVTAE
jgi:carbon monoxide dehydrogenase subunit G